MRPPIFYAKTKKKILTMIIITPTPVPPDSLSLIPKEESIETQDSFVSDIIVVIGKKSLSKFVF